jgi:hypothetical protein
MCRGDDASAAVMLLLVLTMLIVWMKTANHTQSTLGISLH